MRASRLLGILILLQLRKRLSARELADEFEVSERTIYRDVDALSAAGVPVYGDRGPGGGFQLLEGYRTKLTGLSKDEAEAMLMIGLPDAAAALGLGAATNRARDKLMASLQPFSLEGAGRIGERFYLDPVDWYRAEQPVPHLPSIARAVLDSRAVELRYRSWKGERNWTVDPLGLVMKAGNWYAVGASDERITTFKVSSILSCDVSERPFTRPEGFDLRTHWVKALSDFERGLRARTATLRTTPLGRDRLAELGAFAEQAVAGKEGVAEVVLPIETDEHAARQLASMGMEIEVLSPASLRRALADLAHGLSSTYTVI